MKHCYSLILLIFFAYMANGQTADFSYETTSGIFCSPQLVTFHQTSSGNPVSFVWNFGNGKTGNQATETSMYFNAGTYTVKLIAIYNTVAVTVTKTITIAPGPHITVIPDKRNLCVPGIVNFTATGSSEITNYKWNFGDGSPVETTSSNRIMHEYAGYDTFNITVEGMTLSGCNAIAETIIKIAPFKITGTATPTKGCIPADALLKITPHFLPGDAILNVMWNFGDGSALVTNSSNIIHHLYSTTTTISTASAMVNSAQGCSTTFTFDTLAFGTPPTGTVAYTVIPRDSFCGSENIEFFAQANGAEQYKWQFGDGSSAFTNETNIKHTFKSLGNKNVIVTPILHGCEGVKDTVHINIKGVIAKFDITNTCMNKNNFLFPNHSLGNISHFEWSFSDMPGYTDTINLNAGHIFPLSGSFHTDLLLIDNITGCRDTMEMPVYTAVPDFSSNSYSVCKDSEVVYQVNNDYPPNTGYKYEFHINNVIIDNGSVNHLTYHPGTHGSFNDYVVIKDRHPGTCNDSLYLSQPLIVKGPVVGFDTRADICLDSTVAFTNTSYPFYPNDVINLWRWEFGDATIDTSSHPAPHQYPTSRTFNIKLTATDINHCAASIVKQIIIHPLPRVDILPRADTICLHASCTLIAYSSDPVLWNAGQGINCSSCDTIAVSPVSNTNYTATAISSFGCKNYDSTAIKVNSPALSRVSPADTSICAQSTVQLTTTPGALVTWSPTAYLSDSHSNNPVASPPSDITYTVIIQDPAGCFKDTLTSTIVVHQIPEINAGPDLHLDYNEPFTITPVCNTVNVNYTWSPAGDLSCDHCPEVSGIALKKQEYSIKVIDQFGCQATGHIGVFINCANSSLLLPEAFSPNADGINDYFYPIARGYDLITKFAIYNRAGEKVFERNNFPPNIASLGWDGSSKSNDRLNTQTFIWIAEVECEPGQIILKKGTVLLIR